MSFDGEEQIIGTYTSGIELETSHYVNYIQNRCNNCKKGTHSGVNADKEIQVNCSNDSCKCKCKTHYKGRDGRLRPYGTPDDSVVDESPLPRHDPFIEELNKRFRESQEKSLATKNED